MAFDSPNTKSAPLVAVAMSGGVDSTAAAALLIGQGYRVMGISMALFSEDGTPSPGDSNLSPGKGESRLSPVVQAARRACEALNIPHHTLDFTRQFQEIVINYFIRDYEGGRTPNPCVVCNTRVKFGLLWQEARKMGAGYLATGHYARRSWEPHRGTYMIKKARDSRKDQTYFLYGLSRENLPHYLFPLGGYLKEEVKQLAQDHRLSPPGQGESQEICFIPRDGYKEFMARRGSGPYAPGPFLNTRGEKLGEHRGLPFYTVGQRKGLGLSAGYPLYVVNLDRERNAVIVGRREETLARGLLVSRVNYLTDLTGGPGVKVKIRYGSPEVGARLYPLPGDRARVEFIQPQPAIAPGQSAVFYQKEVLVGGGVITERIT